LRIGDTDIHADRFVKRASTVLVTHYHRDRLGGISLGRKQASVLCSPLARSVPAISV